MPAWSVDSSTPRSGDDLVVRLGDGADAGREVRPPLGLVHDLGVQVPQLAAPQREDDLLCVGEVDVPSVLLAPDWSPTASIVRASKPLVTRICAAVLSSCSRRSSALSRVILGLCGRAALASGRGRGPCPSRVRRGRRSRRRRRVARAWFLLLRVCREYGKGALRVRVPAVGSRLCARSPWTRRRRTSHRQVRPAP
jgi:hypothetical protein